MYLAYYDESGDDGYPKYSSPVFVLSALYFGDPYWKECFNLIKEFRRKLKDDYNFPVKLEMHSKYLIESFAKPQGIDSRYS